MLKAIPNDRGYSLLLSNGDYGVGVSIKIKNFEFVDDEKLVFKIRKKNGENEVIIKKEYNEIEDNKIDLVITKLESESLFEGLYSWELEIEQDNRFLMTVIDNQDFIVEGGI